jgi:Protein of unknown function (DUF732)
MKRALPAVALASFALFVAPVACADPDDDAALLHTIHNQGIYLADPIKQGHAVCLMITEHPGDTFADIASGVASYNPSISENDAAFFAGAAIAAYCPRYKYLVDE